MRSDSANAPEIGQRDIGTALTTLEATVETGRPQAVILEEATHEFIVIMRPALVPDEHRVVLPPCRFAPEINCRQR